MTNVRPKLSVSVNIGKARTHGATARAALGAIIAVAALLRLWRLDAAPPGLNQDEAANAWNAWCLLRTGMDQCGEQWPVFYARTIGDNRSTLFFYLLMPFQAVGGLGVWTTRLPMAVAGMASVVLIYWISRRWIDGTVGVVAAGLLAVNPWHLQLSRWANEGSLTAFAAISVAATMTWALGLGKRDMKRGSEADPCTVADGKAALAGVIAGIWCYGYPAIRVFMPLWVLGLIGVGFISAVRPGRSRYLRSAAAACGGFALLFVPLAWQHVFHGEEIGRRAEARWVWSQEDTLLTKAEKVAARYPAHFGPSFLFLRGDEYEVAWASGYGVFPAYCSVLMLAGLCVSAARVRSKTGYGLLLVWLALYPAGDIANSHLSAHLLRGSTGVGPLTMLAAVGAVEVFRRLSGRRMMATRIAVLAAVGGLAVEQHGRFFVHYFGARNGEPGVYHGYHADLAEACAWLRPRMHEYGRTVVTNTEMNVPYVVALVMWNVDPLDWFRAEKEFRKVGEWEFCTRFGGHHFPMEPVSEFMSRLEDSEGRTTAVVARPGEVNDGRVVKQIRDHRGEVTLEIREWP